MKRFTALVFALSFILTACTPAATPSGTPPAAAPLETTTPTGTPAAQGRTLVVDTTADSGAGSFRDALDSAEPFDTITFDPEVFNPENPAAIDVLQILPELNRDHLTIDASSAGVILDGGGAAYGALSINAAYVTIQGLHILHFEGTAITLWENAHHNLIGGDPDTGTGPLGQGNLITGNRDGIIIRNGSSHHAIAGNRIGVAFHGFTGNTYTGIQILDHSPGNVIGPDNVIAFSGAPGIEIATGDTAGIVITRNLIYGEDTVLRMVPPVSGFTPAPVILSSDPSGSVSGVACPGCEVEIFSGQGRWAEYYEGSVTAGADGSFTFTAQNPFSGASLKATATRPGGSTGNFSIPTPAESRDLIMQDGNTSPAEVLDSFSSGEIPGDNRMSQHGFYPLCWYYCQENSPFMQNLSGLGTKHIRLSFNEMEVPYDLTRSEVPDDNHAACINAFHTHGMTVSYILSFWNKEMQNAGGEVPCERFVSVGPGDPETQDTIQFVRDTVSYLSSRGIHEFEIWNEPDNFACTQGIRPENYITLVSLVVPAIREIDPEARVFVGAPSGTDGPAAAACLRTIAASTEIMPLVDGLTWHPFYGPSPAYENGAEYYASYPSFIDEIRTLAGNAGFSGEYRVDELTWRGHRNADPGQPWVYTDLVMPKYYARGILMHLGMGIAAGVDVDARYPMVYTAVRNLSTVMAGHSAAGMDAVIDSQADDILSYGFTTGSGDRLFALWTNGAAVEYDPGVHANLTLTFGENMPAVVTGTDVLYGYTQPLELQINGSSLIIPDLLLKDYPIILRFSQAP